MKSVRGSASIREPLLAAALTAAVELELVLTGRVDSFAEGAAALLVTVPLAVRLRVPVVTASCVIAGLLIVASLGGRPLSGTGLPAVAVLLALYAVGSRIQLRHVVAVAFLAPVGLFFAFRWSHSDLATSVAVPLMMTAVGLLVGRALGVLRYEADLFAEREAELGRERDEQARAAVAEERRRIARELHDLIGHSISVMGIQAGAVRSVLRDDQTRERAALLGVERTGRQTVGEMRRLIGLLRADGEPVEGPVPSLLRAQELVDSLLSAGKAVTLSIDGRLADLSPGVDSAGYRILQEALTNSLKHAPGAAVKATVSCRDGQLEIDVVDSGGTNRPASLSRSGHGLVGMRERVALYDGELVAGPGPDGGFSVHVRIPFEVA